MRLVRCLTCTHVYRNPRERDTALTNAYAAAPGDAVFAALFETQRTAYRAQARRLTRQLGHSGRGIEVGSYIGGFLAAAREEGWTFEGVDVNAVAAAFSIRRGFSVTLGTLDDVTLGVPVDAVAIWNTFEQLYDVRMACRTARRLLRDGGVFVVRVPNGDFYAWWRVRLQGLLCGVAERVLAHNNLLTFPYRQGFTRRSLVRLFHATGFKILDVYGDTLVPIADRWTTRYGATEERTVKALLRVTHQGWRAPWVEVYATAA